MGGDHAPSAVVQGAVLATRELGIPIALVGNPEAIERELAGQPFNRELITIHPATQVAEMSESPIEVIRRKKDASIRVALDLVKRGEVQGVVSAGNSGATMALGVVVLGKLPGVERPALGAILPSPHTSNPGDRCGGQCGLFRFPVDPVCHHGRAVGPVYHETAQSPDRRHEHR